MNPSADLVNRLWRLCALLRKDGVTYQQYVTELTYLLFLKMASEQRDESRIPEQYRWGALKSVSEADVLQRYRQALIELGDGAKIADRSIVAIFQNAATIVREPANLRKLIDAIDSLHWFSEERDAFGDTYEGLLQKMAEETKRGAGQYFTPRVLIEVMVQLMRPTPGEVIQDPAAGTGGFLIAADRSMRAATDDYFESSPKQQAFQLRSALRGLENVQDTFRLLLMNLHLHKIDPDHLDLADTLSPDGNQAIYKNADLILTNPPFGPAGGPPTRDDLTISDRVSSYQLPFVEHCIRALKLGGRAAVVVPDNVLFEDGRGKALRQRLMSWCDLHTVLRLPTGIFYAQGVKTNVLFFTRANEEAPGRDATREVWIYDMRSGAPAYGKTNPLRPADFEGFVRAFGNDPLGRAKRKDEGETGRFRHFTRKEIAARGNNLDITWLKDTSTEAEDGLEAPEDIAAAIEGHLVAALSEVRGLLEDIGGDVIQSVVVITPEGWMHTTLGMLLDDIEAGKSLKCDEHPPREGELGVVKVSAVSSEVFQSFEAKTLPKHYVPETRDAIHKGDLLIARASGSRDLVGRVALVQEDPKNLFLSDKVLRLCVCGDLTRWVYWFLRSPSCRQQIEDAATGISMHNITQASLLRIRHLLPPAAEQRRIVAKLDALTARLARARTEVDRTQRLADRLREASLSAAFSKDRLSKWRLFKLEDLVREGQIGLVRSKAEQTSSSGTPYIRMNHFDLDGRWNDGSLTCVQVLGDELRRYELRAGDVLFNTRNSVELVGKVAIWPDDKPGHVYNNNLLRLRFVEQLLPEFAFRFMMSPPFRSAMEQLKSATTSVAAIYQKPLYRTDISLPPLDEQQTVVSQISVAFSRADRLEAEATRARALLDRLEASLLTKAFCGELVPQDPNDEPASILLERIRAQRVAAPTPRQTRRAGHDRRTPTSRSL